MDDFIKWSLIAIAFAAVWGFFVYGRSILKEKFGIREPLATQIAISAAAILWLIVYIVEQDTR